MRLRLQSALLVTCLLASALAGCGDRNPTTVNKTTAPPVEPPPVTLKKTNLKEVTDYIAAQKGKVVVVDLWNDLCPPCKAEFPNLVKLHNKYDDKVACVSVSVGLAPDEYYTPSLDFLKKKEARFANFMVSEDEEWDKTFDVASAAVPAVLIHDQKGQRVAQVKDSFLYQDGKKIREVSDKQTYEEVNKIVEKLLNP